MSLYKFSDDELYETLEKYPKLKWNPDGYLYGNIDVYHQYGDYVSNDTFEVFIGAPENYPDLPPALIETGGRTKAIAKKYKITNLQDLHCNKRDGNGTACLCAKQEYKIRFPIGSDLVLFIDELVIPYLFALSYFDNRGKWPEWGERSHGLLGLFEAHHEIENVTKEEVLDLIKIIRSVGNWTYYHKQLRKPNENTSCPCGKNKPFRDCHNKAWLGLMKLRDDISILDLNAKSIFSIKIG
jgi:hypothetical protein